MAFPTKLRNVLLFLVSWRLLSVYIVQTSHVPDEYWQSLEVAHRLAFGYGYLTWEWNTKIRSYIYPFLISILYRILALVYLDYTVLLTTLPRIIQALLSGYADYRFYVWTGSKWALFSLCTNWFWYYCASRTLANTLETALTIIALSIYPWPNGRIHGSGYLWIVGFLTAMRPTAAILWTPLCCYHLCTSSNSILDLLKNYSVIGACTIFYSVLIDSLCYGTFVITPWEFFKINVLNGVADFYGTQNSLWYLIAGLPVLLGLQAIVFPLAAWAALRKSRIHPQQALMVVVIFWTLGVYSTLAHKEFRFILPLLPILIHVCTNSLPIKWRITESKRKILLGIFLLSNLLPGIYLCIVHQRGSLDVMKFLENELNRGNYIERNVTFLTPCHATPLYSHLHLNVPVRFLTCEPNLEKLPDYVDEADEFFANPASWLNDNFKNVVAMPDLLVMFDNLCPRITKFLEDYQMLGKIFHAHFPQSNYGQYIMVYRRK